MTERELNQLFYLNRETKQLMNDLRELEQQDGYHSPIITGMPRGSRGKDIADYAAEIADLKEIINLNLHRIQRERARLERYIGTINDSEMRLIIRLRHINCMGWGDIAAELIVLDDKGNVVKSPDRTTVSKKYYKYLRNSHNSHSDKLLL